jgi:predicted nucleic acid-binding protein
MKTYVLDASALFAFLQNTSAGPKVNELLKQATRGNARILMSAVNYGEVYGRILRDHGVNQALTSIYAINPLPIEVLEVTSLRAIQAANVKAKYKLYYADSFAAALAIEHKSTLVTSDSDFRKLGSRFPLLWLKP